MNVLTTCKKILDHYGTDHQLVVCAGEAGELANACVHMYRFLSSNGGDCITRSAQYEEARENLAHEIADVMFTCTQMMQAFDLDDLVPDIMDKQMERQLQRMENGL